MARDAFKDLQRLIERERIEFVDLKTTDLVGRLHHVTVPAERFTPSLVEDGVGFDASSYGFAGTEDSDMVQRPDLSTARLDPFREARTLTCLVTVHLADPARTRFARDVRAIPGRAEASLRRLGIADAALWGPELEFYVFDEAEFAAEPHESYFSIYSREEMGRNAYHAANPSDAHDDLRDRACSLLAALGIPVKYHHHEVGTRGQQEIELQFQHMLAAADSAVLSKYVLHNLAHAHGVRLTFMPKPVHDAPGSGWHVHQYLTRRGRNAFFDRRGYAHLSTTALHYVGGLLAHAPALCAITNPSTNSYKRLGAFEAPSARSFGLSNRSSAVRIPSYVRDSAETRVEYRPPDAMANPHLSLAAMLMAGIDGVVRRLDPVELGFGPHDRNLYESPEGLSFLPRTLDAALDALEEDRAFLTRDGVFDETLIDNWVRLKRREASEVAARPHPLEYALYFDG